MSNPEVSRQIAANSRHMERTIRLTSKAADLEFLGTLAVSIFGVIGHAPSVYLSTLVVGGVAEAITFLVGILRYDRLFKRNERLRSSS